jgi:hypothetical protein
MRVLTRRRFIKYSIAAVTNGVGVLDLAHAQAAQIHPAPETLRAGDLVWTREPETCIPYSRPTDAGNDKINRWKQMQQTLLENAKKKGDKELLEAAQRLQSMSEDDFNAMYLDNQNLDAGVNYSGARFAVGHIGIVGDDQGELYVVEATTPDDASPVEIFEKCFDNGVKKTGYTNWITGNNEKLVWHGRPFPTVPDIDRARIPAKAMNYLGRPYCFDNLDLGDSSAFYCSKLVWLCVKEALTMFIDDDSRHRRSFWLSPKQILESRNVRVLFSPARYGCF